MPLIFCESNLKKKGIFFFLEVFDSVCLFCVSFDEGGEYYEVIEHGVVFEHGHFFWGELGYDV